MSPPQSMDSLSNRPDYFINLDEPIDPTKRLGAGAYGAVYEVKLNGASCIAKRLHDILTGARGEARVSDQEMRAIVAKFRNECSLLSKMRHSNVVQFLGINQTTPDPRDMALIMEKLYMDLEHLITHYVEALTPTSIPATSSNDVFLPIKVHILRDISCGLSHIHSHGVVHRDLNAGNVLLTENLQAKVADLGVARVIKKSTVGKLSVAPGANDYMPPEALLDDPIYDNTLDAFSLGHLMLYLINCRYPTPQDPSLRRVTVSAKKSGLPLGMQAQKRKRWLDHISEEYALCKVVVHCLQDEPHDRPAMSDLRVSLHMLCELFPKSIDTVSKLMNKSRENTDKIIERLKSEKEREELHHKHEITKLKATIKELEDYNKQMKTQSTTFENFKQDREDRGRKCIQVTNEVSKYQEKTLEEKLIQATQNLEALHKQHADEKLALQKKLEEEKQTLQAEKCSLEDSLKNLEEEKLVLTQQVKAYSRQCEELKKTMVQLQETPKLLEEQLHYKERLEHEVKAELQSERDSKAHLVSAFNQEQQKVGDLERQLKAQIEASKQESLKMQNANRTLSMKLQKFNSELQEANDQLTKFMTVLPPEYKRILGQQIKSGLQPSLAPNTPRHNLSPAPAEYLPEEMRVIQRPNYSHTVAPSIPAYNVSAQPTTDGDSSHSDLILHTSTQVQKQLQSQTTIGPSNAPQYKEQLSGSYDQMQEYSRQAQRQREQGKQKLEEDRLRLLEEQRRREKLLADQALRELERAEIERANNQSSRNLSQPTSTGYRLSSSKPGAQVQDNKVGEMVSGASESIDNTKTSEEIPENPLLQNIDQEIQNYANDVRDMTRRPTTKEVEAENEDTSLAFDPNLVCHKCGKRYRIREIQKFKRHIKELCPMKK